MVDGCQAVNYLLNVRPPQVTLSSWSVLHQGGYSSLDVAY